MTAYRIAPGILSADFARIGEEVGRLDAAGAAVVHFDVMDRLDLIFVMRVNPGFGGQSFIPHALAKIVAVRGRIDAHQASGGQPILLEVDGGVKVSNVRAIAEAGADTFVVGSAIFGAPDADGGYHGVRGALRRGLSDVGQQEQAA